MSGAEPARWRLCGEPIYREVGDEVFVLTRDSQMHWLKNDTARALWDRVVAGGARGASLAELTEVLVTAFEVDEVTASGDASRFLAHLAQHQLVTQVEAPQGCD